MGASVNPEAAFIARLTASATHELRNVLAVIKESAGLIDDLLAAAPGHPGANVDKLRHAERRIDAQVGRGAELLANLNRLAHGLDHPEEPIALGQHVRQTVFLCQRFARQGRHRIDVRGDGDGPTVYANALRLHMATAAALDCCLEQLPPESLLAIQVEGGTQAGTVGFSGTATNPTEISAPGAAPSWPRLVALAESLGGKVHVMDEPFGFRLEFRPHNREA
jgi:C4-dicarboxylate-specific signal transduction histidine kinase